MAEVLVLGAGMIGVSTALALQARGHAVTLVDRRDPGQEASYGNAGYICGDSSEPYPLPRDFRTLAAFGLGLRNDVTYNIGAALRMAPALWQYFLHSRPDRLAVQSRTYAEMSRRAPAAQVPLIEAAGMGNLISRTGYYEIRRDPRQAEADARAAEETRVRFGVRPEILSGADLCAREPAIRAQVAGAIWWPDTWLCADPGALVQGYADLFKARGGAWAKGDASTLRQGGQGWQVDTDSGPVTAEHAVVALGAWSPAVLAQFGYRIPMVYKRGYHAHFDAPKGLSASIMDGDNAVVLTSMTRGLRLATGAALVDMNAPADTRQIDSGVQGVSDIIELGPRVAEPQWFGTRPFMPDMLPVVGAAPRHKGLWCHFGHGHLGFTLGPASADLFVEAFEGARSEILSALDPARKVALG
ncbi:NAD(P)/FAD-dependent oxidoreductase [Donghicola mangrovi]|uniref:FAD-binding oxidoreductase n=1 Tax=Donghicola mangrovi TaxID=2729614 RepID=A0A850Q8P2_9RHOB|nr:FAD-binding oxidoreductase [Donghicola mangrovi]NVO22689.1 FAD-binding oxidoreductase [Donghicola mangrovi]